MGVGAPDLPVLSPPLPAWRRGPTSRVAQMVAGSSWGGEGLGGAGTKDLSAPDRAGRAAHLASGTHHLLGAHGRLGQGCGLGKR